ncbi:hypothetical protein [Loktanella sp. Alg231-35]|uniref:hypothetical protein n=1 Tax=Loktanella sp. Alg231-35 TaxID=1922220 RepID=UPI000D54B086|nr:hypothetical protein [Loktanella sp. Alg231-35]
MNTDVTFVACLLLSILGAAMLSLLTLQLWGDLLLAATAYGLGGAIVFALMTAITALRVGIGYGE